MAKVESVNRPSNFHVKNPTFPELKFGLEIAQDCSSKCDFDISSLLSDSDVHPEKQFTDKDNRNEKQNNNETGINRSPLTLGIENPKFESFSGNNLKNNEMLTELNFSCDFSLTDLLSNDSCPVINISKNINSYQNQNDSLFDLGFLTEDDDSCAKKKSGTENDISFDDLADWMNSSVTKMSNSSDCFCNPYCENTEENHISKSSISFQLKAKEDNDIQVLDFLSSPQCKSESSNTISNADLMNILGEKSTDSLDTIDRFGINNVKSVSTNEMFDIDFFPEIDLTICLKKSSKKDISSYGNSPETVDSGFDQSGFISDKTSASREGKVVYKDILISADDTCNKNITSDEVKQSLFSNAISVKPKMNDSRKLKLKNVMKGLFKGTSVMHCNQCMSSKQSQDIIDQSNEHVIESTFSKFTD